MDQETATRKSGCCNIRCWLLTTGYFNLLYDFAGALFFVYLYFESPRRSIANMRFSIPSVTIFLLDVLLVLFILVGQRRVLKCVYYSGICFVLIIIIQWVVIDAWYRFPGFFDTRPLFSTKNDEFLVAVSFGCVIVLVSLKIIQLVLIRKFNNELLQYDNTVEVLNETKEVLEERKLEERELPTINK